MAFTTTVKEVIANDTTGLLAKHSSWERVLLADIALILNGAPFDSAMFNGSEGFRLIRIRDVLTGTTSTYYSGNYSEEYVVRQGDLLIGMDGDFHSAFWGAEPALLNQRVCKITPDSHLYSKKLLSYLLPGYLSAINQQTSAITVKHLSSRTIGEIELPLPPAAEQTRIVEKLEELLSGLDAGVAELKAAQKKLTQYRQSLLKAAVEGALTADWRAAQGSGQPAGSAQSVESGQALLARILTERRSRWQARQLAKFEAQGKTPPKDWQAKYPEPVAPDIAGLPELPLGWVWAGLDQLLCELRSGTAETSGRDSTAYPVLKSSAVRQGTINFGALNYLQEKQSKRSENFLQLGDVLITRLSGSVEYVGCCAVVKVLPDMQTQYPDRVFCGKLLPALIWLGDFIAICFQSAYARLKLEAAAKSTAGHKRISLSDLHGFPIPLPPFTEIHEIVKQVREGAEQVIDANLAVERGLKQSAAQRKNILKAAFSGQLVPQDPNDEPASALLARIRAERAAREKITKARKLRAAKEST